jgi:16S rRNA (guanine527-N7)-methyltransferase
MIDDPACLDALDVSRKTRERLETHRRLLLDWSTRINLVGPATLDQFWSRHALDSLQLLPLAPKARRWLDLGAGAGFPGLVIAAALADAPEADITLVESTGKKAAFLSAVIEASGLPARVLNQRIEQVRLPTAPEVVTARALAPLPQLIEYATPYFGRGAIGLFHKGAKIDAELEAAGFKAHGGAYSNGTMRATRHPSLSDARGCIVRIERA